MSQDEVPAPPPQKKRFFFSVAVFPLSFPGTPTHTCKSSCYITKPHIESQGNSYSICFSCGGAPLFPHLSAHVCFIVPYPPGRTTRGSSIIALSFGTHWTYHRTIISFSNPNGNKKNFSAFHIKDSAFPLMPNVLRFLPVNVHFIL